MPFSSGEVFAGYLIQRLLGAGGMGEFNLAQHPACLVEDALKILSLASISGEDLIVRPNWRPRRDTRTSWGILGSW